MRFDVTLHYPGGAISKNRLWRRGNRRMGMNRVAAAWKAELSQAVLAHLLEARAVSVAPPVRGRITGVFEDRNRAPDLHNLIEVVADAVEDATGVNDRDHEWSTGSASYDSATTGSVTVELDLEIVEREVGE